MFGQFVVSLDYMLSAVTARHGRVARACVGAKTAAIMGLEGNFYVESPERVNRGSRVRGRETARKGRRASE